MRPARWSYKPGKAKSLSMRVLTMSEKPLPSERVSGVGKAAWSIARALNDSGHTVLYVCRTDRRYPLFGRVNGLEVWRLPAYHTMFPFAYRLAIAKFRPDLVHFHLLQPAKFRKREIGYRTVLSVHNSLGREVGYKYDLISCVSRSSRAALVEGLRARAFVALNGVEMPPSGPSLAGRDRNLVLSVSDINRRKGIDVTAKALVEVSSTKPEIRWVHVGKCNDEPHMEAVRDILRGSSLDFDLRGYLETSELVEYYCRAGVFVSSSHNEGLPLTVLEAMSYGCPVCASDIPSHRELISNGSTGLLSARKDHSGMASKISRVLERPSLAQRLASSAFSRIERMTWGRTADSIERHVMRQFAVDGSDPISCG
jgi:glycosyltransferase involved in cell wall biosynthesis